MANSNGNLKRSIRHLVSPHQGTTTYTDTFFPIRKSYTQENFDDEHSDDNFLDEVHATLSNLDEEFDDTEQALTKWSGSYTSGRPTNSTGARSFASSQGPKSDRLLRLSPYFFASFSFPTYNRSTGTFKQNFRSNGRIPTYLDCCICCKFSASSKPDTWWPS